MRSVGSLLLPLLIFAVGTFGALSFRKSAKPEHFVPLLHEPETREAATDFRAAHHAPPNAGPVPAPMLNPPAPRLLGRIEEERLDVRPLGVAKDEPPQLPQMFITGNGALDAGPLEGLDP